MHDVVIVGAGFSGLGLAVRLSRRAPATSCSSSVPRRSAAPGGRTPTRAAAATSRRHLYSFSFAPNPRWSSTLLAAAGDPRLPARLRRRVRDPAAGSGSAARSRAPAWDDEARRWRLETSSGPLSARVLVPATGPLLEPNVPEHAGPRRFEGAILHSAAWDHDHDLTGERVAVIGTGASAIQFVPADPAAGREAARLPAHAAVGDAPPRTAR